MKYLRKNVRTVVFILLIILTLSSCTGVNGPESVIEVNNVNDSNEVDSSMQSDTDNIPITNNGDENDNDIGEVESDDPNIKVSPTYDSTYKLFYGEWEVTGVLGYDHYYMQSFKEADGMIGMKVSYDKDNILANDVSINKLMYSYTINPNIEEQCYFNNTLTNKQLGLTGSYYVFVHVETYIPNVNLGIDFVGDEFFIVDDNKLVFVKNNVFYLAERLSYLDGNSDIDYSHY